MYLLLLKYVKPMEEIERVLHAHREFLDRHYASENFICSGAQVPRTGGVILCNAANREELNRIIEEDPFSRSGVAEYTIVEFNPVKSAPGFEKFIKAD